MRNRAPLAMIELTVMLLIFAFSAAVCLQAFSYAQTRSVRNAARDSAVLQAECAAEVLKSCGGDLAAASAAHIGSCQAGEWRIGFDEAWNETDENAVYTLLAEKTTAAHPLMGSALISVSDENGETLVCISVSWQEVGANG